jgi:hypothetical protein
MGLDLRKRPLADLTPEDEAEEPPPPLAVVDMTPPVEETPSFEHTTGTPNNPDVEGER